MYMPSINHPVLYQPLTRNHRNKTIQNFALVNLGGTSFSRKVQASSGYHPNLLRTDHGQVVFQPVHIVQSPYQHPRGTLSNMVTITRVDNMMSVEQTASWIKTIGNHRGWQEAAVYARNFSENNIRGSMLKHLNHEILKFDMGISNHLHRLYLLASIRQLFPSCNHRTVISMPTRLSDLRERNINYHQCQKTLASAMTGSGDPFAEKLCTLTYLVPDKNESGMDICSVQENNKFSSTNSCSDMEYGESKCPRRSQLCKLSYEDTSSGREK